MTKDPLDAVRAAGREAGLQAPPLGAAQSHRLRVLLQSQRRDDEESRRAHQVGDASPSATDDA